MSDTEGRDDIPDEPRPPYPGWSTQQPPSEPSGWEQPGPQAAGWHQPSPQSGGPVPPGAPHGTSSGGWQTHGAWAWRPPDAKPGVIPLRPLGVGEVLDGAVTTIRKNLGAMLGLSAVVAAIAQGINLGLTWLLLGEYTAAMPLNTTNTAALTPDETMDLLRDTAAVAGIAIVVAVIINTFLTGMLTVVVGRAALGEHLTVREAWQSAKGRLARLLGLLIVYTLIWAGGFAVAAILGAAVGSSGDGAAGVGLFVLLAFAAIPIAIWLYVRFALSTPSLMLETTKRGSDETRPVTIVESLRRSARLVQNSWWRTFGLLLLVYLIAQIVSAAIAVPFGLPMLQGNRFDDPTFFALAAASLGNILTMAITAPFIAAATALIYIDRRIRREGLDLELARAAGVDLPGRTDGPA